MKRVLLAWLVGCCLAGVAIQGAELTVAAASDLKFALDEVIAEFKKQNAHTQLKVTYGSSGNFFAQIQNGAPFDLYFSADVDYPRKLAAAGLALETDVFTYAIGRIVLWVPKSSALDLEKLGPRAFLEPTIKRIAIANPRHAPYGRAAIEAMKSLKVYDAAEPRLVLGENIAQSAQFVQSGAADLGIIALGLALAPQMRDGRYWEIPLESYPKMEQGGMILKTTRHPAAAREFRDFTLSPRGREVLKNYGFYLPDE